MEHLRLENNDYLFEGKWRKSYSIQDMDAFSGKLARKLDNTLGLFCSIDGFSEDAVKALQLVIDLCFNGWVRSDGGPKKVE